NNVDAKLFEGYRDGVLVIVGSELSTTAGHILGLGIADPTYRFSGDAVDGLEDIRDLGGFAIAAHALSARDDLRFTGWDLPARWAADTPDARSLRSDPSLRALVVADSARPDPPSLGPPPRRARRGGPRGHRRS